MRQPFNIVSALLDEMTKINCTWYTMEDQVPPLNLGLTKEQIEKNQERDENIAIIMTQMDLLTKHVIQGCSKVVNAVVASSRVSLNDAKFEVKYNERHISCRAKWGFSSELFKVGRESRLERSGSRLV
ncbi:hypothetical protein MTR67_026364 [Solanum verrucosum]|uniref:Uncharacterized protein n=1 Tax=Solanum verrucosum TaxID=315347 RepID=A0AAF0TUQ8_SOLVR|nr:hypothetical protein MTR67_026364 [Solanum verrucosum]